jgi:tetratricopeptide (TPR) repeat protein
MLVIHNDAGSGGRMQTIEPKPFRRFAFGSLLGYADEVHERLFKRRMLQCSSLALPAGVQVYDSEQLRGIGVNEKYDSVMCHLVLDHGGVLIDDFFSALRADFLKPDGILLNAVKSIAKSEVARASNFGLETQTAPCVIKKDDNYNLPETVIQISTQAELDAWRESTPAEEQRRYVVHRRLEYFASEQSRMYQLERWIVVFGDLTVNHRCSDEFYIKSATSLSYYARDERRMAADLERLGESGYDWKGRSIDCAYDNNSQAWDARYATLKQCRDAFHFDYAELDVIQSSKNEFVVIDVNQTPGPSYKNVYFRELGVRLLADGLKIRFTQEAPQQAVSVGSDILVQEEKGPEAVELLEKELARNPDDARATFRLAGVYRDRGQFEQALATFKKRAAMDKGSDEERFVAQLEVGRIAARVEAAESAVLSELLAAYILRPRRAEPLYELARYFRLRKNYAMATLFAKAGVQTRRPNDHLFVIESIYAWQMLDELGSATYLGGDHTHAKEAWETLLARVAGGLSIPPEDLRRIHKGLSEASKTLTATPSAPQGRP